MSDVAINPANLPDYRVAIRISPQYLVSIDSGKKTQFFLATKFDETSSHYAKFVGFYVESTSELITEKYAELISAAEAANYMEILIPYTRILSIRNLIYKHKQ